MKVGMLQLLFQLCQHTVVPNSSSGGASLTGHSRLHEFAPLGTVLRTLPGGVDSEIMLLKVELNRSMVFVVPNCRIVTAVKSI